jgi:hypothetical protein
MDGLRRAVTDRRPEPRALVPALVLGDTSGLDAELTQDFQATGLAQVRHFARDLYPPPRAAPGLPESRRPTEASNLGRPKQISVAHQLAIPYRTSGGTGQLPPPTLTESGSNYSSAASLRAAGPAMGTPHFRTLCLPHCIPSLKHWCALQTKGRIELVQVNSPGTLADDAVSAGHVIC